MALKSRIPQAKAAISQEMDRLVFRIAHQIRNNAIELINSTPRDGRQYRRGGVTHTASSPGNPPAPDTGALIRSIQVEHEPGSLRARVVVGAKYAKELEFGTRKMAARPFLRPASKQVRDQMPELLQSVDIKVDGE